MLYALQKNENRKILKSSNWGEKKLLIDKDVEKAKLVKTANLETIKSMISGMLRINGLKLYHIRWSTSYGSKLLQIFLSGEDRAVSANDCAKVNRFIINSLEEAGEIRDFAVEVGTIGIERELFTPVHFDNAIGKEILIKTQSKIDGRKQFKGIMRKVEDNNIIIKSETKEWAIPLDMISNAHIVYDSSKIPLS